MSLASITPTSSCVTSSKRSKLIAVIFFPAASVAGGHDYSKTNDDLRMYSGTIHFQADGGFLDKLSDVEHKNEKEA
ncbi:hypothetical protein ACHAW5_005415 [Stephanodiscus triporus]|uniref:Uncharacterized protein n=1 Tax=Stephanodiscus triporus TaxID=2934178 RepID=A0ABD3NQ89_9STRA